MYHTTMPHLTITHSAAGAPGILLLSCMFLVIGLLCTIFWFWMLIDCLIRDFPGNDKIVWVLVILFLNIIGALIYLFVGRQKGSKPEQRLP